MWRKPKGMQLVSCSPRPPTIAFLSFRAESGASGMQCPSFASLQLSSSPPSTATSTPLTTLTLSRPPRILTMLAVLAPLILIGGAAVPFVHARPFIPILPAPVTVTVTATSTLTLSQCSGTAVPLLRPSMCPTWSTCLTSSLLQRVRCLVLRPPSRALSSLFPPVIGSLASSALPAASSALGALPSAAISIASGLPTGLPIAASASATVAVSGSFDVDGVLDPVIRASQALPPISTLLAKLKAVFIQAQPTTILPVSSSALTPVVNAVVGQTGAVFNQVSSSKRRLKSNANVIVPADSAQINDAVSILGNQLQSVADQLSAAVQAAPSGVDLSGLEGPIQTLIARVAKFAATVKPYCATPAQSQVIQNVYSQFNTVMNVHEHLPPEDIRVVFRTSIAFVH
ncbi:hypothetical protein C8F01DRAFT_218593 [Mycena amicta]|nr:hypothetical protein C8F01DRAFT_218593 [Mycena amicta]